MRVAVKIAMLEPPDFAFILQNTFCGISALMTSLILFSGWFCGVGGMAAF